jgi:hypothetical protein
MAERDPIGDAALEIQEEFNTLITEYDNRDVVIRAVTGVPATTPYAANSRGGAAGGGVRRHDGDRRAGQR